MIVRDGKSYISLQRITSSPGQINHADEKENETKHLFNDPQKNERVKNLSFVFLLP